MTDDNKATLVRAYGAFTSGNLDAAVQATLQGMHQGELMGIPPTGARVTLKFMEFSRIVDGKVRERWLVADELGVLRQLGALPPLPGASTPTVGTPAP